MSPVAPSPPAANEEKSAMRLFNKISAILALAIVAMSPVTASGAAAQLQCAPDNGGLTLPEGFCATVFADIDPARHLVVSETGDVFVALSGGRGGGRGGITALRDTDGDGVADEQENFGDAGGTGILLHDGYLYFAPNDRVLRYPIEAGSLTPSGPAQTIITGLPADRNHAAKSIAILGDRLFINMGAPSNACQAEPRKKGSPGMDPCPQLETRGGIWEFSASRLGQTQEADGRRFATGLRNVVALTLNPLTESLMGVQHGRDSLHELWPDLFTEAQRVEKPAEEMVVIEDGDDFGWPYCYFDPADNTKYLGPEYGGDGREIGRCADAKDPIEGFPAHWAPNDLEFYTGSQFPEEYHGGAFIAFHGSWNRAPAPQAGYNITFIPLNGDTVVGEWSVFADGFGGPSPSPRGATHRPVGLALAPDGSLFVADSRGGIIWKIVYQGS
jgi:glucose/arabinose dehydrogenase